MNLPHLHFQYVFKLQTRINVVKKNVYEQIQMNIGHLWAYQESTMCLHCPCIQTRCYCLKQNQNRRLKTTLASCQMTFSTWHQHLQKKPMLRLFINKQFTNFSVSECQDLYYTTNEVLRGLLHLFKGVKRLRYAQHCSNGFALFSTKMINFNMQLDRHDTYCTNLHDLLIIQ